MVVLAQVLGDPVDGVVGRHVERQRRRADFRGGLPEILVGPLHVDGHHAGAVAGEHLGDGRADAAGGAGHQRDLAVQRPVPVGGGRRVGRADPEDLSVDVGRLAGQDEPQRRLEARRGGLRVGGQVHQVHGGAAAQLLAQRAREPLERALRDALVTAARLLGRGADDDDAAGRRRGCAAAA